MKDIEEIYKLYRADIFRYLISLTYNPSLSEDLLSETFIRAIESIHRFKGASNVKTWFFSIARYTWYEHLRKEKKELPFHDLINLYIGENIEKKIINKEATQRIIELLKKEDERNRDIVIMRINGYSYLDIGVKYNISESSARVINFRTKNKIRNILKKEGFNDE